MQIIYIHGFNSDATSVKGQWLQDYCATHHGHITVHRPDLNMPPRQVMALLSGLVVQDSQTAVVGSSLGGFFATAVAALHGVPAVLVNPLVNPFDSMHKYVNATQPTYTTQGGWHITPDQLAHLRELYYPCHPHPNKLLVLLKTGDEVLDYRLAQAHYTQPDAPSTVIVEQGGDHFMQDMAAKIPLMMAFITSHWQKA